MFVVGQGYVTVCSYRLTRDFDPFNPATPQAASPARWGVINNTGVPLAEITTPAETIAVGEGTSPNDPQGAYGITYIQRTTLPPDDFTSPDEDPSSGVTLRHLEGANYLFADGHVKWFKRQFSGFSGTAEATGANATINGVRYYYFWRSGVPGK